MHEHFLVILKHLIPGTSLHSFSGLLPWMQQQNTSFPLHNSQSKTRGRGVCEEGHLRSQHSCSSSARSRCLQAFLGIVKSVVLLRDACRIWSWRQSECRRRYKHNMDARWTQEDNQTCEQELGLLSTAVGHDTGVGHLKRVKFSTSRNVFGFKWHRTETSIRILGYATLYWTEII